MRRLVSPLLRPLAWLPVAASLLLVTGPSDAQQKKARRKKPAAGAAARPKADTRPAPQAPTPTPTPTQPPTTAPSVAEPAKEEPDTASANTTASASASAGTDDPSPFSLLEVSVGLRGFQRHLSYEDDVRGVLPSYDLNGAPAGRLGVAFYPLRSAKFSLGLVGSFEYAFALGSTFKTPPAGATEGTKYDTSAMQYAIGARANFLLGTTTLIGGLDYLGQSFVLNLPEPTAANAGVPDVKYTVIRPNVGIRLPLGEKFAVLAGIGYLLVLDAGEITSNMYFEKERASVSGIDVNAGISYALSSRIELRPMIDYRRYAFTFKPLQTDTPVAGGATDAYLGASVSAAYAF